MLIDIRHWRDGLFSIEGEPAQCDKQRTGSSHHRLIGVNDG